MRFTASAAAALAALGSAHAAFPPAGAQVNISSVGAGVFVRHCDFVLFATQPDDNLPDDFQWLVAPPLNGAAGAASLESVNYPGYYLAAGPSTDGAHPRVHALQSPDADDASWAVSPGLSSASFFSLASLSKNASYAGLYLSQAPGLTGMCAPRYAAGSGDLVLAPAGAAGIVQQTWSFNVPPPPAPVVLAIDTSSPDHVINRNFLGCHVDPGYVSEPLSWSPSMVFGNSFENDTGFIAVYSWNNVSAPGVAGSAALDASVQVNPLVNAPSLKVTFASGPASGGYIGQSNRGIGNEGLAWLGDREYEALAVVYAPAGATLYAGAHDRNAGVVHASATVTVPASNEWQVVNFTLLPSADATCAGIAWGSDPTIDCGTPNNTAGGSLPAVNPGQVCVRCAGEVVFGLGAPGTAWIGYTDFRPGAWGTFGPGGVAQLRTVQAMQAMGITVVRQGGTVSQTFAWKDWRGLPWQRAAMQHYWGSPPQQRLIPVTWGLFEAIDTFTAAGIEPIVTLAQDLNSVQDWGDLVEYCWGNASTPWGAVRTVNDSHPQPYAIRTFELGNEQQNPNFVAQVAAMEARAVAVGAPALRYLYPQNSFPNATGNAILALGGAELAQRTMPDVHVWGARGGSAAAAQDAARLPDYPSSFANLEVNARTSTLTRAVSEAADLQDWFNVPAPFAARLLYRTTSFCTERSGHFDGYDQGLVYFLPNATWLQPPGYAHGMAAAAVAKAPNALPVTVDGQPEGGGWLAASSQLTDDGTLLIVQLVNTNAAGPALPVTIQLSGGFAPAGEVLATSLADPAANATTIPDANAGNTPWQPEYISPQQSYLYWPRGASSWTLSIPPSSYYVLEVPRA